MSGSDMCPHCEKVAWRGGVRTISSTSHASVAEPGSVTRFDAPCPHLVPRSESPNLLSPRPPDRGLSPRQPQPCPDRPPLGREVEPERDEDERVDRSQGEGD